MTILLGLSGLLAAAAQTAPAADALPVAPPLPATPAVVETSAIIPQGTVLEIVIDRELRSDRVVPGERFPLHLAEPVVIGGRELLPAGLTGEGEVIDAKKSGIGGVAGSIVVNARYLQCGANRIPIGKMHLVDTGKSGTATATILSAAIGPLGMLVKGHNGMIVEGAVADAKITADMRAPAAC